MRLRREGQVEVNISKELKDKLKTAGMTDSQLKSATLQVLINALMPDPTKEIIAESQRQIEDYKQQIDEYDVHWESTKAYHTLTDEKAKNAVTLYNAILAIDPVLSTIAERMSAAEHIVCAYLGAKSFTEINVTKEYESDEDEDDEPDDGFYDESIY
jgi:hypothetical protein